ncbi:Zinc ABC transporter, inner membrane permease protein ZnuB [Bathymodiolus heckerae thiotrophic gill symbiont]|uniref:metal ABC transporter permease n=1 Tax=Bathymodiolus heckerae thiotrophic gill symbiont TaxID=1052212 RepID=UPI0010B9A6AA|nr:iron chelate uptake ABC transporter family permease subunit [Bathymodiolus heckerae thiotrophic gill symbiont]SMN12760.1 Zinc ABC transporter, inner membrane permease protein ZnuB [Bathymodiolus heckerae thiotrophic gill symbiont]SMN14473.1 Zinc ABC transporter, inner membrane permease protein ZnuB [uncultured Candidatus Thioglobus sp.]
MEDFIIRAALAAIGISIIAGSLGCFVIWKRMSYFSESISHSALLGVSLGLVSGLGLHFGLLIVGAIFSILIVVLQQRQFLSNDAILGIFSHISLSLGIVLLALVGGANTDYFSLLFGDILSISNQDIIWIYAILVLVSILLSIFWQRLLLLTLNEELGVASGLNRLAYQLLFMLMIALTVSVSVQIVGVLLITSLLIIPPATARVFARSPAQMVLLSIVVSMIAVVMGLSGSIYYDVATGPAIVIALGILFLLSQILPKRNII